MRPRGVANRCYLKIQRLLPERFFASSAIFSHCLRFLQIRRGAWLPVSFTFMQIRSSGSFAPSAAYAPGPAETANASNPETSTDNKHLFITVLNPYMDL